MVLACVVVAPVVYFWAEIACGERRGPRVSSPGLAHHAYVYETDCGAVSGWNTRVIVVRQHALDQRDPDEPPRSVVLRVNVPADDVELHWDAVGELAIDLPLMAEPRVRSALDEWDGVRVRVGYD